MQRQKTKILSLKEIIFELCRDCKVSVNCSNSHESISDDGVKEFLQRAFENSAHLFQEANIHSIFAVLESTLHFYSPKAYMYMRDKMNKALPYPSVVRSWYNSVDSEVLPF